MMRMVDVSDVQFTVGRPFAPKTDQSGAHLTEKGAGRPLHVVQLVAIDGAGGVDDQYHNTSLRGAHVGIPYMSIPCGPPAPRRARAVLMPTTPSPIMGLPWRVRVKGMRGVDATMVVTVVQDRVWLSISPPFTWEAIMEPGKVDEVISMLELARDEATRAATVLHGGKAVVRATTRNGSATQ